MILPWLSYLQGLTPFPEHPKVTDPWPGLLIFLLPYYDPVVGGNLTPIRQELPLLTPIESVPVREIPDSHLLG